jgi:hypothetical protein
MVKEDLYEEPEELIRYAALIHNSMMTATLKVTPTLTSNHFGKTYLTSKTEISEAFH